MSAYTLRTTTTGRHLILDATGKAVHITNDLHEAEHTVRALNHHQAHPARTHRLPFHLPSGMTNALFAAISPNKGVHPDTLAARAARAANPDATGTLAAA